MSNITRSLGVETSSSLAVVSSRASLTGDSSVSTGSIHLAVLASRALITRKLSGRCLVGSVRTEQHGESTSGAVFTGFTGSDSSSRADMSRRAVRLDREDSSKIQALSTGGAVNAICNFRSSIVGVELANSTLSHDGDSSSAPASLTTQITCCTINGSGGDGSSDAEVTSEALDSLSSLAEVTSRTGSQDALRSGVTGGRVTPLAINAEGRSVSLSVAGVLVGAGEGGCHSLMRAVEGNRAGSADYLASSTLEVAFFARNSG